VRFGKKCGVLQKLLTTKEQLRMHTDTLPQTLPGRPPSSPYGGGSGGGVLLLWFRKESDLAYDNCCANDEVDMAAS
jgi:hypothetical protein